MAPPTGTPPVLFPWPTLIALGFAVLLIVTLPVPGGRRLARCRWWAQLAVSLLAASFALISEAISRGWVLSQSQLLLGFSPWNAQAPAVLPTFSNPLLGDAVLQGYPWLVHTCRALGEGRVPLWSSQIFAGAPFAAPAMTAVFSPFTWVACLVPLPWATVALAALKMVSCGLGTAALARALGSRPAAAALVAVGGALNPFLVVWLENASDSVAAVAPWVFAAAVRACHRPGGRSVAALGTSLGWLFVAGQPQTAFAVAACAGGVGLALTLGREKAAVVVATLLAAALGGALVAAVQVLPLVEYLRESRVLAERSERAVNNSYTPARALITVAAPDFYGNPASQPTILLSNRHRQPTNYVEQVAYPGVTLLVLAAIGVVSARRRVAAALVACGSGALAVKFGAPGVLQLASALPLVRVTPLGRFGLVWVVAVAALAALGLHALTARDQGHADWRRMGLAAVSAVVFIVAGCAGWIWLERHGLHATGLWRSTVLQCLTLSSLAAFTAMLAVGRSRRLLPTPLFTALVALAIGGELVAFGRGFRPMTPPALVYPPVPALTLLQRDQDLFRVAGWGTALLPNTNLVYGLAQYRGYDGMNQRRYGALLDATVGPEWQLWMDRDFQDSPILDLLNVKYLVTAPTLEITSPRFERLPVEGAGIFLNHAALPRALLVDRYVVAAPADALRQLASREHDPRTTVILEEELAADARPEAEGDRAAASTVTMTAYRDELVELATSAPGRRLLVLSDAFYPGWVATLDARPVPILRGNYAFRAVAVPAGRHVVRFAYRPRSVATGAAISLAALLAMAALAWRSPR